MTGLIQGTPGDGDLGKVVERYMYDSYGNQTSRLEPLPPSPRLRRTGRRAGVTTLHGDADADGEVTEWDADSTPDWDNRVLFCGYWRDGDTELDHVRHRFYHPTLGRWLTRDPLGYIDGMSLYEYCGGIPTSLFDPYGLTSREDVRRAVNNARFYLEQTREEMRLLRKLLKEGASACKIREAKRMVDNSFNRYTEARMEAERTARQFMEGVRWMTQGKLNVHLSAKGLPSKPMGLSPTEEQLLRDLEENRRDREATRRSSPGQIGMQVSVDLGVVFGGRLGIDIHIDVDDMSNTGLYLMAGTGPSLACNVGASAYAGYTRTPGASWGGSEYFQEANVGVPVAGFGRYENTSFAGGEVSLSPGFSPFSMTALDVYYVPMIGGARIGEPRTWQRGHWITSMIRFPKHSSSVTIHVDDPRIVSRVLVNILIEELHRLKARRVQASEAEVTFAGGVLRLVSGWNLLSPITHGQLRIEHQDQKLKIRYSLTYPQLVAVATVAVGFLGWWAFMHGFSSVPLTMILGWTWLVGANAIIMAARFNHFVRKCIKRALLECTSDA